MEIKEESPEVSLCSLRSLGERHEYNKADSSRNAPAIDLSLSDLNEC
jgi:hypothetical protein